MSWFACPEPIVVPHGSRVELVPIDPTLKALTDAITSLTAAYADLESGPARREIEHAIGEAAKGISIILQPRVEVQK